MHIDLMTCSLYVKLKPDHSGDGIANLTVSHATTAIYLQAPIRAALSI